MTHQDTNSTMEFQTNDGTKQTALTFIKTNDEAIAALKDISAAEFCSLDTETVARDELGNLRDLDVDGPGDLRVISIATLTDGVLNAYVLDMSMVEASVIAPHMTTLKPFAWNANFDETVLLRYGMEVALWEDLMLYQACLKQGAVGINWYTGLAQSAKDRLGLEIEGKGDIQLSYTKEDELSSDQIFYAAIDAIATLLLAAPITAEVEEAGIAKAVELEIGARSFISSMQREGVPFDSEGWLNFLREKKEKLMDVESRLAEITDGGQSNLFGDIELSWKPTSSVDVRKMLNEHNTTAVKSVHGRLLEKADSTDNDSLKELANAGSNLAELLMEHRNYAKLLSTYGDSFVQ